MPTTLTDLLRQAKEKRNETSGRALADLATEHGHPIDRTQVNAILGGTYKSKPGRPLLEAVAWLAQVDEEVAFAAARVPLPGPPFAEELPPDVDYLGPQERQAVIGIIRAFLSLIEESRDRDDITEQEPTSDEPPLTADEYKEAQRAHRASRSKKRPGDIPRKDEPRVRKAR